MLNRLFVARTEFSISFRRVWQRNLAVVLPDARCRQQPT